MGFFIIIGLLIWGWAEISTFNVISNEIGVFLTLFGVFLTAFVGIFLLKHQGFLVLARVRSDMATGQAPVTSIADSIALVFGGVLMLIPGYVTDTLGLLLFIPGFRTISGVYLLGWVSNNRRFNSYVNFADVPVTQRNRRKSDMNDWQDYPYFSKRGDQTNRSDIIIEGEAEERPNSGSQLNRKNK